MFIERNFLKEDVGGIKCKLMLFHTQASKNCGAGYCMALSLRQNHKHKNITMSKNNSGIKGQDATTKKNKGESQESRQKGAKSVGQNSKGKHKKDESDGADHNTTKKQSNSI